MKESEQKSIDLYEHVDYAKIRKKTNRETITIIKQNNAEQKENGYKFTYSSNFDEIKYSIVDFNVKIASAHPTLSLKQTAEGHFLNKHYELKVKCFSICSDCLESDSIFSMTHGTMAALALITKRV